MCARSSSVRSSFLVCRSSTIRRPDSWPVDSPEPPLFCPTAWDSSVASHFSSSPAVMLTASRNSRRTVSASVSAMCVLPGVSGHLLRYRRSVARKRTDVEGSARARGESPDEVLDRNVDELLQETRVATAGVQFLFAFLLTDRKSTRLNSSHANISYAVF